MPLNVSFFTISKVLKSVIELNGATKGLYFIILKGSQYCTLQECKNTKKLAVLYVCFFSRPSFPNDVSLLKKIPEFWAKFKTFMNNLVNKCNSFEDPLFSRLFSRKFPTSAKISRVSTTITFIVIELAQDILACLWKVAGK